MSASDFDARISPGTGGRRSRSVDPFGTRRPRRYNAGPSRSASVRQAKDGEVLETRRMRDGRIGWTTAGKVNHRVENLKWHATDAWFARLMGLDLETDSECSRYGGLYKEWLPMVQQKVETFRCRLHEWIQSLAPWRRPATVVIPHGTSLRIVRASTFVRHLCELCGSDVVKLVHLHSGDRESREAMQLADEGYVLLEELDEGTCVEVLGQGQNIAAYTVVTAARPGSRNAEVEERG